jgi:hypothetical protein
VNGCGKSQHSKGLCSSHYMRLWKYGNTEKGRDKRGRPSRDMANYVVSDEGCHEWQGALRHGYGPHRAAWEMANKMSAKGFVVRHSCDNPKCINPAHLEIGNQQDNLADMRDRGRGRAAFGENSGAAKLTEHQVREIRSSIGSHRTIAAKYGVSGSHICNIRNGKKWVHSYGSLP